MRIIDAQSALIQPVDRDYKKHGKKREERLEVKRDGLAHTLKSQQGGRGARNYVVITYIEEVSDGERIFNRCE